MTEHILKPCPYCGGAAVGTRVRNCDTLSVSHTPQCLISTARRGDQYWHFDGQVGEREEWPRLFEEWDTWVDLLLAWARTISKD